MLILPNRIQWRAFIVVFLVTVFVLFCATWFVTLGRSAETISASKKTVLVLYGDPLSIPADRMTEQGLTAGPIARARRETWKFSRNISTSRVSRAAQYGDDLVRYLRARYTTRKPDVVIAVEDTTLQFAT